MIKTAYIFSNISGLVLIYTRTIKRIYQYTVYHSFWVTLFLTGPGNILGNMYCWWVVFLSSHLFRQYFAHMKSQSFTKYAPRWLQNENKTTNQATTDNIKLIVAANKIGNMELNLAANKIIQFLNSHWWMAQSWLKRDACLLAHCNADRPPNAHCNIALPGNSIATLHIANLTTQCPLHYCITRQCS